MRNTLISNHYLNEEDLISQQWIKLDKDDKLREDGYSFKKDTLLFAFISWYEGIPFINISDTIKDVIIEAEKVPITSFTLYSGKCKSITEFKIICTLLEIE